MQLARSGKDAKLGPRTWVKALRGCYFPGEMFDTAGWFGKSLQLPIHETDKSRDWFTELLIRAILLHSTIVFPVHSANLCH
jgi:hypothetical protein